MRLLPIVLLVVVALASSSTITASADDTCTGFKWDVSQEHALFVGPARALAAGGDASSAPAIDTDRLYELTLAPQDHLAFALPPGKPMRNDGAYAGLAILTVAASGAYRVSIDVPAWIDLIAAGKLAPTKDFQGLKNCDAPHKIVEYDMIAAQPLVLQLSGSARPVVRLTVTRSPAATH